MNLNLKTVILLGLIQVVVLTLLWLWFVRSTRINEESLVPDDSRAILVAISR